MALAHGYALPFVTQKVVGDYASDNAAATARAIASGATKEAAGSCLDARAIDLQMRVPQRTDTNLLTNSAMAGATGSVLPTKWVSGSVSGLTMTISSAFTSAGFQAIDWTVSGTAAEDGTIYIGCEPNDNTNAIPASVGQQYIGAMSLGKQAGTIPATMVMQVLGQVSSAGTVNETANNTTELATLTSSSLTRINTAVLSIASATTDRVNFRLTADVAALDVISFTIRIAAPQVERNDRISPYITTTTGAASRVTGQPSLLIVPQLTRAGFVYPQLPTVSGADFTFTRATTATRVNASGLIESVASGVLRLDYPVTGGCPAALIEASGTNLALQSEAFNTTWTNVSNNLTISANVSSTLDPAGGNTADLLTVVTSSTQCQLSQNITTVSGTSYVFSIFGKKGSGATDLNSFRVASPTNINTVTIDWDTGVLSQTGSGATSQNYGNGWWRIIIPFTAASTTTTIQAVTFATYATGLSSLRWGAQFEVGSTATPYIPTTTGSVFRDGTVFPQLPTVSGADFTFTRATTATRVNASGLIESVASGLLRLDYPVTGGCPAALIEPAGTNLVLRSEEFNVSGTWTLVTGGTGVNPAVTANAVISPDGTQNAETVVFNRGAGNTSSDQSTLQQSITLAASGTYTFSVYAKATTSGDVGKQIFLRVGGAGSLIAYTLTSSWVRLSRTETSLASGSNTVQIGNRGTFSADNSVSVDLWGGQVETGAIPTSYIPTTTGSATRNADVCTVSGVSGYIGQTQGTLYAEFEYRTDTSTRRILAVSDGSQLNRVFLYFAVGSVIASIQAGNLTVGTPVVGFNKVAFSYIQNGVSGTMTASLNGAAVVSGTSAAYPTSLTTINLGKIEDSGTTSQINSRIRAAAIYPTRLSNDELQNLTRLT